MSRTHGPGLRARARRGTLANRTTATPAQPGRTAACFCGACRVSSVSQRATARCHSTSRTPTCLSSRSTTWAGAVFRGTRRTGRADVQRAASARPWPLDLDATAAGVQPAEAARCRRPDERRLGRAARQVGDVLRRRHDPAPAPPLLPNCGVLELFTVADVQRRRDRQWRDAHAHRRRSLGPVVAAARRDRRRRPDARPLADLYAPGGYLRHPRMCRSDLCAVYRRHRKRSRRVRLLLRREHHRAVDQPAGNGVDLVWNASTWDPYRVILLRTRIEP